MTKSTRHNMSNTKIYKIWDNIMQKHKNPSYQKNKIDNSSYDKSWDNFLNFYKDVGDPPSSKHKLVKIDPYKDFTKCNVHWVLNSHSRKTRNKTQVQGSTPYKGVYYNPNLERYVVTISNAPNPRKVLGFGKDPAELAKVYDKAAIERWGDQCTTNHKLGLV